MKHLLPIALTLGLAGAVHAQGASCKATAGEKNLHGAALTSFMKKCQADATKACKVTATGNKLSGAAKTSFTTKCVRDKVGK